MWQSYRDRVRQQQGKRSREEMQIQEARNNLSHPEHSWNTNNILWNSKVPRPMSLELMFGIFILFLLPSLFPLPLQKNTIDVLKMNYSVWHTQICSVIPLAISAISMSTCIFKAINIQISTLAGFLQLSGSVRAFTGLSRIHPKVNWGSHRDNALWRMTTGEHITPTL